MSRINSPFRYPGGKFYARSLIADLIPSHSIYCEPFAGGASIFFAKPKAEKSWLNDLDSALANTFIQIRDDPDRLISLLDGVEASKEMHTWYKKEFKPSNRAEEASRWFYLNRTSYSGITKPDNCYWGYDPKFSRPPEKWAAHIREVSAKLQNVKISSQDFQNVINSAEEGSFLFVDPPYYNSDQHKFYAHTFAAEDHRRLSECLKANTERISFLLTYDSHSDIRDMYSWCSSIENREWNYTINRTDYQQKDPEMKGKRGKGQEIFIRNYSL